jgi:glycosyltransferase involved in cell wall biosynthesis
MKLSILCHNLSSNAAMRAHRLALMGQHFADVEVIGPAEKRGPWPAFPDSIPLRTVRKRRFPEFFASIQALIALASGDVLIAVKPHLASLGTALLAATLRPRPVLLDFDDLDSSLAPRHEWPQHPEMSDLSRPGSAAYVSLLERAAPAADLRTAASRSLARRFDGLLLPHGAMEVDPACYPRRIARKHLGLPEDEQLIAFPGTPHPHKGVEVLLRAAEGTGARVVVTCRPGDLAHVSPPYLIRMPLLPFDQVPWLFAAADIVAIPQLDVGAAHYQMPIKLYDAMAMGCAIISTRVSDIEETLGDTGLIVNPGDDEALRAAIAGLLDDPDGAQTLGAKARQRSCDLYSIERQARVLRTAIAEHLTGFA